MDATSHGCEVIKPMSSYDKWVQIMGLEFQCFMQGLHAPYHTKQRKQLQEITMGVSTHSQPQKVFIFSAYRATQPQEVNEANHQCLTDYFNKMSIPVIPVIGRYQGVMEEAFLTTATHIPEEAVLFMTRHYNQDNYMVLENHKHGTFKAYIVDCKTTQREFIGFMREMPEKYVEEMQMDYTYRPDLNTYWVLWDTDTTVMTDFVKELTNKVKRVFNRKPEQEPFGTPAYC